MLFLNLQPGGRGGGGRDDALHHNLSSFCSNDHEIWHIYGTSCVLRNGNKKSWSLYYDVIACIFADP